MENSRAQWSSKLGFILAAAGSAIGLGNIWKFPGRAFEGGGGTFVLIYLLMVIFFGVPLMLTELSVGRASQANVVGAFHKLGHRNYSWVGWVGVVGAFVITCYYSHVGGWVLRYVVGYAFEAPEIYADPLGYFYAMLGYGAQGATFFPWIAVLFAAVFMLLNAVVIIRGGGAVSDLSCFDDYTLCAYCAQYELPILSGIGHTRDVSVLDMVAHEALKTPTAVAEWLIHRMDTQKERLETLRTRLLRTAERQILIRRHRVEMLEQRLAACNPERIYRMGYSLLTKDGRPVRSVASLRPGDIVTTHLSDGAVQSSIINHKS